MPTDALPPLHATHVARLAALREEFGGPAFHGRAKLHGWHDRLDAAIKAAVADYVARYGHDGEDSVPHPAMHAIKLVNRILDSAAPSGVSP